MIGKTILSPNCKLIRAGSQPNRRRKLFHSTIPTDTLSDALFIDFAKNLPKFEKRWVKTGKNGEISGKGESL